MKKTFWKIIGASIITSIVVNGVVNTTSRIRRNKLEDENYQEEIKRKKEEREAKKEARELKKLEKRKGHTDDGLQSEKLNDSAE